MNGLGKIRPPQWANRFLTWYCRPELLEDLEGDLNEYFDRNLKLKGRRRARMIYVIDVFKFLRAYTLKKPELLNIFIQWIMLSSYIKISGRIILRNRLFSAINIFGLAISMAVGLLLIGVLSDMFSYDKFHANYARIYRVVTDYKYLDQDQNTFASTSLRAGKLIPETIPGIDTVAILHRGFEGDMTYNEKVVPLSGLWANQSFFSVFTFPMVYGDPSTALKSPYSIVLTEESAKKLFGDSNAIGKPIIQPNENGDVEFTVTGVVENVPHFSHFKFDMLVSLSTREITEKDNPGEMAWDYMWNAYVYLLMPRDVDIQNVQTNLNTICAQENKTIQNSTINLALQPLQNIALGEDLNNAIGMVMGSRSIWVIGVLTFIVILSACFNYTNLSIARSLRRAHEVGIRKVIGARWSQLVIQFIVEAVIIALYASVFSFFLFVLIKPYFISLNDLYANMLVLDLTPRLIAYFILMAAGVGVLAGLFPALFFARTNATQVLKNISAIRLFRNVTVRKALIVVQFTVSLIFISGTIIGVKQYREFLAFDLGFDTENVLNIKLFGKNPDLLKKALLEMPEVTAVSKSSLVTSIGDYWGVSMKYNDPSDSAGVYFVRIDENYLPLHGHELLAGRNFREKSDDAEETEVIVNEKVLRRFNIANGDPSGAIGEIVTVRNKKIQIIGVVKDYSYGRSTDLETKGVLLRYSANQAEYINAKILSADLPATLSKIESVWKEIDPVHPLEARFYDDQIENSYIDFSARIKVVGALAFLAICIASIGLLGMVVFTTETRLKEISIRKVLGANEGNLVYLLSKGFLALLAISAVVALPTTQFVFINYVLDEYVALAPTAWRELFIGMCAVIGVAFVLIGSHTLHAARRNPAEILKSE